MMWFSFTASCWPATDTVIIRGTFVAKRSRNAVELLGVSIFNFSYVLKPV